MKYSIFEGNMGRLTKKLNHIQKKCEKYNSEFKFDIVGEEFKIDEKSGKIVKYVIVDVIGTAAVNGWEFIASIEHTENGNIIVNFSDTELPKRYINCDPICEHCNSNRYRKYTCIIRNTESGKYKQVGKSCLLEYTGGIDAEYVAKYISLFDTLIECEHFDASSRVTHWLDRDKYLRCVYEIYRVFGYLKTDCGDYSTAYRAYELYELSESGVKPLCLEGNEVDIDSEGAIQGVENWLDYISNEDSDNGYINNLKVALSSKYIDYKHKGIASSICVAYHRHQNQIEKSKEVEDGLSKFVGNLGDELTIDIASIECLGSYDHYYFTSFLYKFTDIDSNVYIWSTNKVIRSEDIQDKKLVGTIKDHREFNKVKQTHITRCRLIDVAV